MITRNKNRVNLLGQVDTMMISLRENDVHFVNDDKRFAFNDVQGFALH